MTGDPLGDILLLAVPLGVAGVFILALFERMMPLLPSPGLFAAIGIAAAEGSWCLHAAIVASVMGSGSGALAAYGFGRGIVALQGQADRIRCLLRRRDRIGTYLRRARLSGAALPFAAQLVPAARLAAPVVAGAVRQNPRFLALATLAGLTVWNVTFIASGYALAQLGGAANVTAASLLIVSLFVGCYVALRLVGRRRARSAVLRRIACGLSHASVRS